MKTVFKIELNTKNLKKVEEEDNEGNVVDVTNDVEKEIHNLFSETFEYAEFLKGFTELILEDEFTGIEGAESLNDYGNINIKIEKLE